MSNCFSLTLVDWQTPVLGSTETFYLHYWDLIALARGRLIASNELAISWGLISFPCAELLAEKAATTNENY